MSTPASPTWHVDHGTLAAYADGTATPLAAASVEEHLLSCDDCRLLLGPLVEPAPLDLAWEAIRERVERRPSDGSSGSSIGRGCRSSRPACW